MSDLVSIPADIQTVRNDISRTPTIQENPAAAYLMSLSAGSRRTMRQALDTIASALTGQEISAQYFDWSQLRYRHTVVLRAWLDQRYAPSTANKMLAALRRTLQEAYRLDQMEGDAYSKAVSVASIKHDSFTPSTGRILDPSELHALMMVCLADDKAAGVRDAALIGLMVQTGLRRAEVTALDREDYDAADACLRIHSSKGNRDRTVYVSGGGQLALDDWCLQRDDTVESSHALFVPINKGGRIIAARLSNQAIYRIIRKRAVQAGIADLSPHDLRRTFISTLLEATGDLSLAAAIAGHSSADTTRGYDLRGEDAKRTAAGHIHVPYHRSDRTDGSPDDAS